MPHWLCGFNVDSAIVQTLAPDNYPALVQRLQQASNESRGKWKAQPPLHPGHAVSFALGFYIYFRNEEVITLLSHKAAMDKKAFYDVQRWDRLRERICCGSNITSICTGEKDMLLHHRHLRKSPTGVTDAE